MQACLALAEVKDGSMGSSVSDERLQDCVNVILSYQNGDGGWATYENTRSYSALEVRDHFLLPVAAKLNTHRYKSAMEGMSCIVEAVQIYLMLCDFL